MTNPTPIRKESSMTKMFFRLLSGVILAIFLIPCIQYLIDTYGGHVQLPRLILQGKENLSSAYHWMQEQASRGSESRVETLVEESEQIAAEAEEQINELRARKLDSEAKALEAQRDNFVDKANQRIGMEVASKKELDAELLKYKIKQRAKQRSTNAQQELRADIDINRLKENQ